MNNLFSYHGLVDAKIRAYDKDLPVQFTEKYPNEPPKVKFQTNMFHPNIYADGQLCLDILARKWSPTFDVLSILISVQSLLGDPNPESSANPTAAQLFMQNKPEYVKRVKLCVEESYIDDPDAPLDLRKPLDENE